MNTISIDENKLKLIWTEVVKSLNTEVRPFLESSRFISFNNNCFQVEVSRAAIIIFSDAETRKQLNDLLVAFLQIPGASVEFSLANKIPEIQTNNQTSVFPDVTIAEATQPRPIASSNELINYQFNPTRMANNDSYNAQTVSQVSNSNNIVPDISINNSWQNSKNYATSGLSKLLTFDTFVKGDNNSDAYGIARIIADNPGVDINPCYFFSGVGLGKTHLMNAIGNYIISKNPNYRVLITTAENFMNDFTDSLSSKKMPEFHKKYREELDALLIDDFQFMATIDKTSKTHEEFFHTFNALRDRNKQIVVSSDRSVEQLKKNIESRIYSRLLQGTRIDIKAPNLETRIAILKKKAEQLNVQFSDDILLLVAETYSDNVRELEGALNQLVSMRQVRRIDLTLENAKDILKAGRDTKVSLTPKTIIQAVCEHFNLSEEDLYSDSRKKDINECRQIAIYLIRNYTTMTLTAIGNIFHRGHNAVLNALDNVKAKEYDTEISMALSNIKNKLDIRNDSGNRIN